MTRNVLQLYIKASNPPFTHQTPSTSHLNTFILQSFILHPQNEILRPPIHRRHHSPVSPSTRRQLHPKPLLLRLYPAQERRVLPSLLPPHQTLTGFLQTGNYRAQLDQAMCDVGRCGQNSDNSLFYCIGGDSGVIQYNRGCSRCVDGGSGRNDYCG